MKAMLHRELERMNALFQKYGVDTAPFPENTSSLTALLLKEADIAFFFLPNIASWSMGHVLAAAKLLSSRGGSFLLWEEPVDRPPLLRCVHTEAALEALLKPKIASTGGTEPVRKPYPLTQQVQPLAIPPGAVLLLGVVGSQGRVGCTTQTIALYHYCKILGFSPAICQPPEVLASLTEACHGTEIPGGYRIEGIPFVTGTALDYDCYVLDLGAAPQEAALEACDQLILVGGWKPWEIAATASAWVSLTKYPVLPVLSFLRWQDLAKYQPLFGGVEVFPAPYVSGEPWTPNPAAIQAWDRILRQPLEAALERQEGENYAFQENDSRNC